MVHGAWRESNSRHSCCDGGTTFNQTTTKIFFRVWCAQIVATAGARDARVTEAVPRPSPRRTTAWTVGTFPWSSRVSCKWRRCSLRARVPNHTCLRSIERGQRGGGAEFTYVAVNAPGIDVNETVSLVSFNVCHDS